MSQTMFVISKRAHCNHPHDTQTNEALNQSIANITPKSICYSGTISLYSWIALVNGMHNIGYYNFFVELFNELGAAMALRLATFLKNKQ